ncbi:hypothetical protein B0H11DRAFT_2235614 [Mycena galericulata]|nr:hypothetical protein B0H11DRAFT_2235614 [Mycena galericulata]
MSPRSPWMEEVEDEEQPPVRIVAPIAKPTAPVVKGAETKPAAGGFPHIGLKGVPLRKDTGRGYTRGFVPAGEAGYGYGSCFQTRAQPVDPTSLCWKFRGYMRTRGCIEDPSHHAPLARHLHRLKKSPTPDCPCCGAANETVEHYLHFCPAHEGARRKLHATSRLARYSKHLLTDPTLLPDLFLFVQRSGRFHSVFGDFKELERPQ